RHGPRALRHLPANGGPRHGGRRRACLTLETALPGSLHSGMAGIWTGNSGLRRAHAADLAAIMDMERQTGYELVVGQSTYAEHIRNISRPGQLYLVSDDDRGMPHAFAALCGLGYRERDVLLKRLMVRTPGQGTGSQFLSAVMRAVFEGAPT